MTDLEPGAVSGAGRVQMGDPKTSQPLVRLQQTITRCTLCPRLVQHRTRIALRKRRAYRDWTYWGRPVPAFGDPGARLLILGLAPGAHGANRTGRMFTGDRSGDFLYAALFEAGFCTQPESRHAQDGQRLLDTYITAAVRCAPPDNRPTPQEKRHCLPYLQRELELLSDVRVVLALGGFAWGAYLTTRRSMGCPVPRPQPRFGHGAESRLDETTTLIGSYHPSQQNTLTGRLTSQMFSLVLQRVRRLIDGPPLRS